MLTGIILVRSTGVVLSPLVSKPSGNLVSHLNFANWVDLSPLRVSTLLKVRVRHCHHVFKGRQ